MRISDWSSDVCSSDLFVPAAATQAKAGRRNLLDQLRLAAFRTDGFRRIGNLVQDFAVGATGRAVVVVNGHHIPRKLWSPYGAAARILKNRAAARSEEHTSELQSLMRTSYAVFCLKKKKT